jgi:peptidoglycan/LPS O-acetylase OafA/YrhL
MINFKQSKISLLSKANLDQNSYHSILISLLRGMAAIEVAAAHVRAQTLPSLRSLHDPTIWYQGLSFFTGFAHQAVVVFFLLSGWLVGGSLLNKLKNPNAMLFYFIDRVTRLWIVLIPAFLATIIFAMLKGTIHTARFYHSPGNEYSLLSFIGNLFGLQNIAVPEFGGNFSLWSLSYETWYYILFPLILISVVAKKVATKIIALIVTVIFASNLSITLLLYFSV